MRVSCRVSSGSNRTVSKVKALLSGSYSNNNFMSKAKDVYGSTSDVNILAKLKALGCSKITIES